MNSHRKFLIKFSCLDKIPSLPTIAEQDKPFVRTMPPLRIVFNPLAVPTVKELHKQTVLAKADLFTAMENFNVLMKIFK